MGRIIGTILGAILAIWLALAAAGGIVATLKMFVIIGLIAMAVFLIAARNGDFDALLEALDPDVVVRSNGTEAVRGAAAVAARAFPFTRIAQVTLPALINGAVGVVTAADGRPVTLVGFTIIGAKIVAIDLIDDPRRIAEADLAILGR